MTTLDEINQAAPIDGSHTIKTHGHYTGWPIQIDLINLDGSPTLRIQQRPNHRPDTPAQTIFMQARNLTRYLDQLRDAAHNGRLVKNPPLPLSAFKVQPTGLGLKVRYFRTELFFVNGGGAYEATKSQWEKRGFRVLKGEKPAKRLRHWHIRNHYEFILYPLEATREISGSPAKYRRRDFYQIIEHLERFQTQISKLQINSRLPL